MLLWDWPNIKKGVTSLKDSRLQGIYIEVAPSTKVRHCPIPMPHFPCSV